LRTTRVALGHRTEAGGRAAVEGMHHLQDLEVYDLQSLQRAMA